MFLLFHNKKKLLSNYLFHLKESEEEKNDKGLLPNFN
jgi:hypothetical protein